MTKLTFAEKMEQAKATRKNNIKLNIVSTHASNVHAGYQKSQYVHPLSQIQKNEIRIKEIQDYLYNQYRDEGYTEGNLEEREQLGAEKMTLLTETHYLRNPQRTPEMDKGSYQECGGKYQHLPLPIIKSSNMPEDDNRPATFGEFDAEWF